MDCAILKENFSGIEPFKNKIWLSSPTMHGDEKKWVNEAIDTNWVSTVGENINEVECRIAEYAGVKYAVGLSCGTAALHIAIKLAAERLYGQARPNEGTLKGHKVFCSDMTFDASINPVAYEDGEAVFIDTEYDTWNMSPKALEKAFEMYPDVRLVVIAHLYGTPGRFNEIREICRKHGALIVEDAAESLGAKYRLKAGYGLSGGNRPCGENGRCGADGSPAASGNGGNNQSFLRSGADGFMQNSRERGAQCASGCGADDLTQCASECWTETGALGDYNAISFNGNKIITGSAGGMFLTNSKEDADKARKWSTQSREAAPWYEHEEIGYNYRMSNIIAGIVRGQLPYLDEHIAQKKAIYERYKKGFEGLPARMNPFDDEKSVPNFWLSCLIIDKDAVSPMVRGDREYLYKHVSGKSSPHEILDALSYFGAEGRPIWKPMHMQPIYRGNAFVTVQGNGRGRTNAYIAGSGEDIGADIFSRGLCLPSDNKMTPAEQERIIEIVRRCFR